MQLRQAEAVRAPHDHGIGARDVEAALDDVGGQQHVALAIGELDHHPVYFVGRHLAMRDPHGQFGYQLGQRFAPGADILDARHHEEALPAAPLFAQQRGPQRRGVERRQEGANRPPARRRVGQHADILDADHRRLQGPGDRGRRQGQDMTLFRQRSQPLLGRRAELLFLVDDHQAEIGEIGVTGGDRMGADHDADLSRRQALANFLGFLGRLQPR